jgi:hypothetical protein
MRISRQSSPIQIMVDKPLDNVEYFNSLGNRMTKDGRCTREIKSRVAMAKATFKMKKTLFSRKCDFSLSRKLVKC